MLAQIVAQGIDEERAVLKNNDAQHAGNKRGTKRRDPITVKIAKN